MTSAPNVSIVIPTYREEEHLPSCLEAVRAQTYPAIGEVLVVDGRSPDRTREIAASFGALVLDNPDRIQSAALNIGIAAARGEVIVRLDGHCIPAPEYVERCIEALNRTGAAMVGGAMAPVARRPVQRAVAAAMSSPLGAGPARFHLGGGSGWVDTVYLGAYQKSTALTVGGYATDVGVNEDAEFAHRMATAGGVWLDESIHSTYSPRASITSVVRQFWRYGRSRAATLRKHPDSLSWRQLAAPALVLGLASPRRGSVAKAYLILVALETVRQTRRVGRQGVLVAVVLPAMHLPWGVGLLVGLLSRRPPR